MFGLRLTPVPDALKRRPPRFQVEIRRPGQAWQSYGRTQRTRVKALGIEGVAIRHYGEIYDDMVTETRIVEV